ncbi:MAG: hypothetical protein ONB44_09695 [candidate division KSB1 bacterium]|nr:hypothetical protein [candidate division KSB1 bacterium]MDZ7302401.1 hypothetical protein [candidate division KSB1 bacterium]
MKIKKTKGKKKTAKKLCFNWRFFNVFATLASAKVAAFISTISKNRNSVVKSKIKYKKFIGISQLKFPSGCIAQVTGKE